MGQSWGSSEICVVADAWAGVLSDWPRSATRKLKGRTTRSRLKYRIVAMPFTLTCANRRPACRLLFMSQHPFGMNSTLNLLGRGPSQVFKEPVGRGVRALFECLTCVDLEVGDARNLDEFLRSLKNF